MSNCEYWINEQKQARYEFQKYVESVEDDRAKLVARMMKANNENLDIRKRCKTMHYFSLLCLCVAVAAIVF